MAEERREQSIAAYNRYAALRDERGITDYQVSRDIGVFPSTFSNWKCGDYTPKLNTLLAIARLFNVSLRELVDISDGEGRG